MTARDLLERGAAAARSPLMWAILAAVVVGLLVERLDAGRRAAGDLATALEAQLLDQQNLNRAVMKKAGDLERERDELAKRVPELQAELERVKKAAPGARPVVVVQGTTGSVPAAGAARPSAPPGDSAPAPAAAPACLLAEGDRGEIRVDQVLLETKARNLVFVGTASAWRVEPGPPARLFGGTLQAKVSAEAPERPAGWGVGVAATAGRAGWMVGPAAALPPARLWSLQGELSVGVAAGPGGEWGAVALGVVRRWR